MKKKKQIPLIILQALEPYVKYRGEKFEVIESAECLFKAVDIDLDSEFQFILEKYQNSKNNTLQVLMTRNPKNPSQTGPYQAWIEVSDFSKQFDTWLKLLSQYESIPSFYDDPVIKAYKDEFYAEFEIIDEESNVNPLSIKQILFLDAYLEEVDTKLFKYQTGPNAGEIEEIKVDINTLRSNLTKKSKKWVITKLSIIWAKMAKQGIGFIKEFLTESKKEAIKQGVKMLIQQAKENLPQLLD